MGICKDACMGTSYSLAQISAKTIFTTKWKVESQKLLKSSDTSFIFRIIRVLIIPLLISLHRRAVFALSAL